MASDWSIEDSELGIVNFRHSLIQALGEYRQLSLKKNESGGVLVGKHLNSGGAIIVDDLTRPQPSDSQGRCNYYRSKAHNEIVRRIWKESSGSSTYVGLWHSHPEPIPSYSSADKSDWINALKNSGYEGDHLLFVIVGQIKIRCWLGRRNTLKIEYLGDFSFGK